MNEPEEHSFFAPAHITLRASCAIASVLLLTLAGCHTPAAPFDPFLAGRTTIPPPGTAVPITAAPVTAPPAPGAAAPYYDTAPPVVSVPGATTTYPPPGVIPGPVPTSSLPPAGSGRFPRGITLPQTSTQTSGSAAKLAGWQPADASDISDNSSPRDSALPASNDNRTASKSNSGVVRASHTTPSREPPIRIVAPQSEP